MGCVATIEDEQSLPGGSCDFGALVRVWRLGRGAGCSAMEFYDQGAGKWEVSTPMPIPRMSGIGAAVGGCLYVTGGFDGNRALKHAVQYNPNVDCWEALPAMKQARWFFGGVVLSSRHLYACGGWDGKKALQTVERLTKGASDWEMLPPLLEAKARLTAAAVDGSVYVCGGWSNLRAMSSMERFNPCVGHWEMLSPTPQGRAGAASVGIAGRLYVIGGWDGDHCLASVERFDPEKGSWCTISHLPRGLRGAAATTA